MFRLVVRRFIVGSEMWKLEYVMFGIGGSGVIVRMFCRGLKTNARGLTGVMYIVDVLTES